jgi:hypothetical protein
MDVCQLTLLGSLGGNRITDVGCAVIAASLKFNSSVEKIG